MKAECCLVAGALLASTCVAATPSPALDPGFLTYLERFGDARGEVFDARDLAETEAREAGQTVVKKAVSPQAARPSGTAPGGKQQ